MCARSFVDSVVRFGQEVCLIRPRLLLGSRAFHGAAALHALACVNGKPPVPAALDSRGYWLRFREGQRQAKLAYVYFEEEPPALGGLSC
jgi:hypothetical protein